MIPSWARLSSCLVFVLLFSWCSIGSASSEQTEKALAKASASVWYDAHEKSLTFPPASSLQASEDALANRHRNITTQSNDFWDKWRDFLRSISDAFAWIYDSAIWILWGLLALLIVTGLIYLWLAVERGWYVPLRQKRNRIVGETDRERAKIVDLPFNIETPVRGLLEQAEAFRRKGEFSKSIVYLFSHVLVELDDADCIRLQRGKTNRVYLRELNDEPRLTSLHSHLVQAFEAVFFGGYAINEGQCDRCWNLLPAIQQAIVDAKLRRTVSAEAAGSNTELSQTRPQVSATSTTVLGMILIVGAIGCNRNSNFPTDNYGGSNVYSRKSVSGLTVLHNLYEKHGARTFEINGLSHRSYKLDTIVWAPKDFRVPSMSEIEWFDDWFSTGVPRTLIFIGRDYSPASHYWIKAAESASPEDRRTFRLQQSYSDVEMEVNRLRIKSPLKCDWFEQQLDLAPSTQIMGFRGPWSQGLSDIETHVMLRGRLKPNTRSRTITLEQQSTPAELLSPDTLGSTGDIEVDSESKIAENVKPKIKALLTDEDGSPIISTITYQPWGEGRLILVANGSVLMNEALTNRGNQQIAERLIADSNSSSRVGILSNIGETKIRLPWDEQEPKGFEWLRVWPLSLIAIQGLFMGAIALLAMLPIFGRPQKLPSPSTTDFGKHIEALGDLLSRSRDRNYALQRIADYFRDVRRDSASPWSTVAPTAERDSPDPTQVVTPSSFHSNDRSK